MKVFANDIVSDAKKLKIPLTRRTVDGKRVKRSIRELEHAVRTKKVDRLMRREWAVYKKSKNYDKGFYNGNNMSAKYKMFYKFVSDHFGNNLNGTYFPSNNVFRIFRNWEKHRNTSSSLNKIANAFSRAKANQNEMNIARNSYEWYANRGFVNK